MQWDLFQKIIDEATSEPRLTTIVFELQNEPLLDERIFDCVAYIKTKSPDKLVVIISNGELLDKFDHEKIVQSNLDSLLVSLNANSKEMYERLNTGLNYERVRNNVSSLLSNPALRQRTKLNFVLTAQNTRDVFEATEYWHKQGVCTRVSRVTNRAGALNDYDKIKPKTGPHIIPGLDTAWKRMADGIRHSLGCHIPFYEMSILYNGAVLACSEDWNRTSIVGNAATQSLKSIWNGEKINNIRRLLLRKRFDRLESCKDCSLAACAPQKIR
jgi:radical SAM protein with 4Fe4S-binding SPASM domain